MAKLIRLTFALSNKLYKYIMVTKKQTAYQVSKVVEVIEDILNEGNFAELSNEIDEENNYE